tara:strand:+ start:9007 stop:10068 length:1062 start_codon:yes stop_codon:yes gene_type:complete
MNKNKIKKYLNETFITEKFVKGVKYNIRNANNGPNDKGDNYTYIDNLEGGRFKSDDGHFFTIGDTGSNWKISQINEDKKPKGLSDTEKVQKDSEKFNKEYQKEVGSKMSEYDKAPKDEKENDEVTKKYENSKEQKEIHDELETLNGLEMTKFDNKPDETYSERAKEALEGSSRMGNNPEWGNVITADQAGFTGPEFGKNLSKRIKSRVDKESDAQNYDGMGDVAIPRGKNKKQKQVAISENKIKRLTFKKPFNGLSNALDLIPESYKIDNKVFQMTDGDEKYQMVWKGTLSEGKAVVTKASNKVTLNEDMLHMKHLMGYKSEDTGSVNENISFRDGIDKIKSLLSENDNKLNK